MVLRLQSGNIIIKLADNSEELEKAQKLRYKMLVLDYDNNKEVDGTDKSEYDETCDHLIAVDKITNQVVGTYRLKRNIDKNTYFVSEMEYNLDKLKSKNLNLLELSRAVVDVDYRNGVVIKMLWQGLFLYCKHYNIRYMFGTGSFHGLDISKYKNALSFLHYNCLAEKDINCPANEPSAMMNILPENEVDNSLAKSEMPPLIKGYIALGCKISNGVYFDESFNSADVLVILDINALNRKYLKRMFGVEM